MWLAESLPGAAWPRREAPTFSGADCGANDDRYDLLRASFDPLSLFLIGGIKLDY